MLIQISAMEDEKSSSTEQVSPLGSSLERLTQHVRFSSVSTSLWHGNLPADYLKSAKVDVTHLEEDNRNKRV